MNHNSPHSTDFDAMRLKVASPEVIKKWSHGEISKPETINYRTQKPEKGGLLPKRFLGQPKIGNVFVENIKKFVTKE